MLRQLEAPDLGWSGRESGVLETETRDAFLDGMSASLSGNTAAATPNDDRSLPRPAADERRRADDRWMLHLKMLRGKAVAVTTT